MIIKQILTALASALIGALVTAFLSLLMVGNSLHALESRFDRESGELKSRISSLEASVNYLREERRLLP